MSREGALHDHVVPLPGGTCRMWRLVAVRGPGFFCGARIAFGGAEDKRAVHPPGKERQYFDCMPRQL